MSGAHTIKTRQQATTSESKKKVATEEAKKQMQSLPQKQAAEEKDVRPDFTVFSARRTHVKEKKISNW